MRRRNMIYLFVVSINHPKKICYQKTSDPFLFHFQIELKIETTKKSPWNLFLLIQIKSLSSIYATEEDIVRVWLRKGEKH